MHRHFSEKQNVGKIDCMMILHILICDLTYNWFQYTLEKETAPVVFIVSTTGDGEPPDNALKFVKCIKKKTLSNDHYEHLCYALLGKFCFDRLKLLLL